MIDLDDDTVAVLRAWRKDRGSMALQLITPASLVFGDIEGQHRNPEHVSRQFGRDVERCGQVPSGEDLAEAAAVFRESGTWPGTRRRVREALAQGLQQRGDLELNLGARLGPVG